MENSKNIIDSARRMRELAGISEGTQKKTLKTIHEGVGNINLEKNKDLEDNEDNEFETHKFDQKKIEESEKDEELYNLNENTVIIIEFSDKDTLGQ